MSAELARLLSEDGPIARSFEGRYEPRAEQNQMAAAVELAMADRSHILVEAGTGVGKSFAYLVPAIRRCLMHDERVVISTHTIALQEQLVRKDIPRLVSTLGAAGWPGWSGELKAELVKGRNNYVSIRRLELAMKRREEILEPQARFSLQVIDDWARTTRDGSLATRPMLDNPETWDHVRSDRDNCMGRQCRHYEECFYQASRRRARNAQLIVCNHALFFADLSVRMSGASILPEYDHVVLDEAHTIEDVASEHLGIRLSQIGVTRLLNALFNPRYEKGFLRQLASRPLFGIATGEIHAIEGCVVQAGIAARDFFDEWLHLHESGVFGSGRVRHPGAVSNPLTPAMSILALRLKDIAEGLKDKEQVFELRSYINRVGAVAEAASTLVDHDEPDAVHWIDVRMPRGRRMSPTVTLGSAPIEVGRILREHLFDERHSVVLTSATLSTRRVDPKAPLEQREAAFSLMLERLGCAGADVLQLGSPFDHATQAVLYIDRRVPDPRSSHFNSVLAERVLEHVRATNGGAFVLFTSFATLNAVADLIGGRLAADGLSLLVHGRGGPRTTLLERFRHDDRSVLLGAATFWQGVDVQGDALRNVIITRLPFDPPNRPITEARLERIRERGGDPFNEESLPRAILRFKQGFGRLIRSRSDSGRVVVLDPRIVNRNYGRRFLQSLPAGLRTIELEEENNPEIPV